MNLEHSGRKSYSRIRQKTPARFPDAITERRTHLEHERRGERGEYEITYNEEQCYNRSNQSNRERFHVPSGAKRM
jgi:hypothetical protein